MSKYQEALNWLRETTISLKHNQAYNILQELVDRATPMKPLHVNLLSNPPRNIIVCGKCSTSNLGQLFKYCSNCGQKIDWRYEE